MPGEIVYVSNVHIVRESGPVRIARLPGEPQPVVFSVHGGIAAHYGRNPAELGEPHAATLDYIVAAAGGDWSARSGARWRRAGSTPAAETWLRKCAARWKQRMESSSSSASTRS